MRDWSVRQWLAATVAAVLAAGLIGIVTALIPNPIFVRMIDAPWWSYPVWILSAALSGLLLATYVAPGPAAASSSPAEPTTADGPTTADPAEVTGAVEPASNESSAPSSTSAGDTSSRRGMIGAVLSFLAVGCPTCNKLVVVALGTSGAVTVFEPLQPVLAVGSLALLAYALRARLRTARSCPTPVPRVKS